MQAPAKKKSPMLRKSIALAHLWLGLASGIVVFIVAITGCLWVFQEEIVAQFDDYKTVEPQNAPVILPTEAQRVANDQLPGRHIHGILYGHPDEAVEVIFYESDPEFYQSVFINPYSGEVIKVVDHERGFFHFVLEGHMHLWLAEEIGSTIVSWSTVIFVILLISGLYLWWPRTRKNRKKKFLFTWNSLTNWKRKIYDLHSIAGMYASFVALLAAITGLMMAFSWFETAIYSSLGGDKQVSFTVPANSDTRTDTTLSHQQPIDALLPMLQKEFPHARSFEIHTPPDTNTSIYVEIVYKDGVYYSSDYRFYDSRTLEAVSTPSVYGIYNEASIPDKIIRMSYDTHVGAILGLPGKILMFSGSFIVASLPVTGFLFWRGKRSSSSKRK